MEFNMYSLITADPVFCETYDFIIDYEIATEAELTLVCCINGRNVETLNSVIFARTGYRNMEQIKEELFTEEE